MPIPSAKWISCVASRSQRRQYWRILKYSVTVWLAFDIVTIHSLQFGHHPATSSSDSLAYVPRSVRTIGVLERAADPRNTPPGSSRFSLVLRRYKRYFHALAFSSMISHSRFSLEVSVLAKTSKTYRPFRVASESNPLPPLAPYVRCRCGSCHECRENAKWDRVFAKFEIKASEERGVYQSALNSF
jgi:hypothetical protein